MVKPRNARSVFFLFAIALLLAAIGGSTYIYRFIHKSTSAREVAKIHANGEPTTIAELKGESIPDSDNAAVVYEQAHKLITTPQAEEDFKVLALFAREEDRVKDPKLWEHAQNIVPRYSELVPLIEKAQQRPKCQFEVEWDKGPLEMLFYHMSTLRRLADYLNSYALLYSKQNQVDRAIHMLNLAYRLNAALRDEPALISVLVNIANINKTSTSLRQVLNTHHINQTQAIQLLDAIADIDYYKHMKWALQGERVQGIWLYDDLRKHGPKSSIMKEIDESSLSSTDFNNPLFKKQIDMDETFFLRKMKTHIANADKPYRLLENKKSTNGDIPVCYILSSLLLSSTTDRSLITRDGAVSQLAMTRTSLALAAFRSRTGTYPATLSELQETLNWKLPEDPFSGRNLIYKPKSGGYILYSIGPDLKDDGGKPAGDPITKETQGDIVWEMKH